MQAPYVRNSGKIIKNDEFLSGFCIFLTRREAAITQRKLPSSFDKAHAENVAFIPWRNSERFQRTGEQRDVRSFLLPNFRAGITVFSCQTSSTLSFLESCEAHKKMQGKTISLSVGNTQHLIPKIIMTFPHRTHSARGIESVRSNVVSG